MSKFKQLEERIDEVVQSFKDQIIKGQFTLTKVESSWIHIQTESGHDFTSYMNPIRNVNVHGTMKFEFNEDESEFVKELFKARHSEMWNQHIEEKIKALEGQKLIES